MAYAPIDWILLAVIVLFAFIGLWRGLAGELATLAGFAAAACAVCLGSAPAFAAVGAFAPSVAAFGRPAGIAVAVVIAILAFGTAHFIVRRFVSLLVPQPTNAIMGTVAGAAKGVAVAAVVMASGLAPEPTLPALRAIGAFAARAIGGIGV